MDPTERRILHLEMTMEQANAQERLVAQISALRRKGVTVACAQDPKAWDSEATPVKVCVGCPALELCTQYAMTGAVTEGVIAGMLASRVINVLKARKKAGAQPRRRGRHAPLPTVLPAA